MDTLKKAEALTSIFHIAKFLRSEILIYNFKVLDTAGRKTRRRTTQIIAKSFTFHTLVINVQTETLHLHVYSTENTLV